MSAVELSPAIATSVTETAPDHEAERIVRSLEAKRLASRRLIEQVVTEELVRFRGARIRTFVPILVERAAMDRLALLSLGER